MALQGMWELSCKNPSMAVVMELILRIWNVRAIVERKWRLLWRIWGSAEGGSLSRGRGILISRQAFLRIKSVFAQGAHREYPQPAEGLSMASISGSSAY